MLEYSIENEITANGFKVVCGVDEAGRGPLVGPVAAAACILPAGLILEGLDDSKKLSAKKREKLYAEITEKAITWAVALATAEEIEEYNILGATLLAMQRAVSSLSRIPDFIIIDGNAKCDFGIPSQTVVGGDSLSPSIAAASIIAKVTRDRLCLELDEKYPGYGIAKHKGYGTKEHIEAIKRLGPTPEHRRKFIRNYINNDE